MYKQVLRTKIVVQNKTEIIVNLKGFVFCSRFYCHNNHDCIRNTYYTCFLLVKMSNFEYLGIYLKTKS